jgi:hypothetical protein
MSRDLHRFFGWSRWPWLWIDQIGILGALLTAQRRSRIETACIRRISRPA